MKKLVFSFLLMSLFGSARADVFFPENVNQFIKTKIITRNEKKSILFSGCSVTSDRLGAVCTDLAMVEKAQFKKMRQCERLKMGLGGTEAVGGVVADVAFILGGGMFVAPHVIVSVAGIATKGAADFMKAYKKAGIYSSQTESGISYLTGRTSYKSYIKLLNETLKLSYVNCDVSEGSDEVSKRSYRINLSTEQIDALWLVEKGH